MKKTILISLILLTFCFSIFTQEDKNIPVGTVVSMENRPADEGKISGNTPEYKIRGNNLEYLKNLRRPDLQIIFNSNQKIDVESSKKIRKVLDSHWKKAIRFYHNEQVEEFPNEQTATGEMLKWTKESDKNRNKLQKVLIETPNGKRKISKNEADGMLAFLNQTAVDIMEEAKEAKGEYIGIKLISKPHPNIGNCSEDNGVVILRVTFDKSAKITDVKIQSFSGCLDFDQNAVRAAKRIKFDPATVAGEPITLSKRIEYRYRRF